MAAHLRAVLRLGHGDQELEDGLRLGHERGDGVDDGGELGVGFDTCRVQDKTGSGGSEQRRHRYRFNSLVQVKGNTGSLMFALNGH